MERHVLQAHEQHGEHLPRTPLALCDAAAAAPPQRVSSHVTSLVNDQAGSPPHSLSAQLRTRARGMP